MLKGYDKYKRVNAFGIDKVPLQWNVKRTFSCLTQNKKKNVEKKETLLLQFKYGTIVPKKIQDAEKDDNNKYEKYSIVCKGDIAINGLNLNYDFISQRVASVNTNGIITSAYLTFTPRKIDEQRYLVYLFKGLDSIKLLHGLGTGLRQTLTSDEVLKLQIPVPPKPEQDKIVQFLDWKTSEMNRFIHQKKKQIKLLEELKYTQIDQYITKGLNPSVSMKDSKVEWIGEIPEHWEVIPAKRLFLEKKETRYETDEPCTASQKYGIISQKEYMLRENSRVVIAEQGLESWKHVSKDDFVISLRSFQGGIEKSEVEGCVTWHYIVLRPNKEVNPNYYKWLLKSKSYITALQTTSEFIRDGQDLRYSNFIKVPLLKIPYREQQEIAEYLEEFSIKIDEMISGINREITLVEELRTKLISDAVTGQVDVRDVRIPIYEAETDIIDSEDDTDEENLDESMEE